MSGFASGVGSVCEVLVLLFEEAGGAVLPLPLSLENGFSGACAQAALVHINPRIATIEVDLFMPNSFAKCATILKG